MVNCWELVKEAPKWRVGFAAYQEAIKNGTASLVIDGEDDDPGQKTLPPLPRGHKATKADLAREASTLTFSHILEKIMANNQATMILRDEKKHVEKRGRSCHLPQPHQKGH